MEVERAPAVPQGRFERVAEIVQLAFGAPRYLIGGIAVLTGMLIWLSIVIAHHFRHPEHATWCKVANFTVSSGGGGRGGRHFSSVSAAVEAAPDFSPRRFCIHIREGRYMENVLIGENKTNLVFLGDGIGKTVITGTSSDCRARTCSVQQATLWVRGRGFMAADITVESNQNSTVAIENRSDKSVFLRCRFSGQHGAVHAYYYRQLYRECQIDGAGFLVTGEATAIFQKCSLTLVATTAPESRFVVAAQSTDDAVLDGIFVFHLSDLSISGGSTTKPPPVLGLALGAYSRIVYIRCILNFHAEWSTGGFASSTLFFGVYENVGPGASSLNSSGVHFLNVTASSQYSVRNLIGDWLPVDVPVALDLA